MNRSCFDSFPRLETERLILREINPSDVEEIFEIFSDEEVAKYDWFYPIESQDIAIKFINRYREEVEEQEEITWGVELKETDKLIGTCCLGDFV